MKTRIHVNQHNIKKPGLPVLTVKDYRQNRKGNTAIIMADGAEVARVVYRPEKPLSCGAKCWIETEHEVVVG